MSGYLDNLAKRGGWTGYGPREAELVMEAIEKRPARERFGMYCAYAFIMTRRREVNGRVIARVADSEIFAHIPKTRGEGHYSSLRTWREGIKRSLQDAGLLSVISTGTQPTAYAFPLLEKVISGTREVRRMETSLVSDDLGGNRPETSLVSDNLGGNRPETSQAGNLPSTREVRRMETSQGLGGSPYGNLLYQEQITEKTGKEEKRTGISVARDFGSWVPDLQEDVCPYCKGALLANGGRFKCSRCGHVFPSRDDVLYPGRRSYEFV